MEEEQPFVEERLKTCTDKKETLCQIINFNNLSFHGLRKTVDINLWTFPHYLYRKEDEETLIRNLYLIAPHTQKEREILVAKSERNRHQVRVVVVTRQDVTRKLQRIAKTKRRWRSSLF